MAERRMFAKTIIDSDAFLDMPLSTQALYFHLSMRADDDGFINNPKKIQRMIGASDDDLKLLIAKSFVIIFESGVVVIKHWKIHNYIRNDRYKETVYTEEKSLLTVKDNSAYTLGIPDDNHLVYQMDTQVRIGKDRDRIGKDRLGEDRIDKDNNIEEDKPKKTPKAYSDDPELDAAIKEFIKHRRAIKSPMTDKAIELFLNKLDTLSTDKQEQIQLINTAIERGWKSVYPIDDKKNDKVANRVSIVDSW